MKWLFNAMRSVRNVLLLSLMVGSLVWGIGCTRDVDITSDPPGANVFYKYNDKITECAGITPKTACLDSGYRVDVAVRWPDMTCSDWQPSDNQNKLHFKKELYPQGLNRITPRNLVTYHEIKPADNPVGLSLQVDHLAVHSRKEDPNEIGALTQTVLALPSLKMYASTPLPISLHYFVTDTLERAGYSILDMQGQTKADAPVLMGEVKDFWFAVYLWAAPVFYSGGKIEYRMFLQSPNGELLWEKTIKADGHSATGFISLAVSDALTKMLNEVMATVQSEPFLKALQQGNRR